MFRTSKTCWALKFNFVAFRYLNITKLKGKKKKFDFLWCVQRSANVFHPGWRSTRGNVSVFISRFLTRLGTYRAIVVYASVRWLWDWVSSQNGARSKTGRWHVPSFSDHLSISLNSWKIDLLNDHGNPPKAERQLKLYSRRSLWKSFTKNL